MDDVDKELIKDLGVALDAWLHQYAFDLCDEKEVERYAKIVYEGGGTLAYIADLRRRVKKALDLK